MRPTPFLWLALALAVAPAQASPAQATSPQPAAMSEDDPYLWLEDVEGERALAWVRERNAETKAALESQPGFAALQADLRAILDSEDRIPTVVVLGDHLYNHWKDKAHPAGIWRRTTLAEYRKPEPAWEVLIDLDRVSDAEGLKGESRWVWHGAECLKPDYDRCLVALSRGGSDADVTREFDVPSRSFVADGFNRPEAKGQLGWIDRDTVFVSTDFGPGTMTTSGYARIAKVWKRGTPMSAAQVVYEGKPDDLGVFAYHDDTTGFERSFVTRYTGFYSDQMFLVGAGNKLTLVDVPESARKSVNREHLLLQLRDPWTVAGRTYPQGSLLRANFADYLAGKRELTVLFTPTDTTSLEDYTWTRHHLVLNVLDDVKSRLTVLTPAESTPGQAPGPGEWKREPFVGAPALGKVSLAAYDDEVNDDYFLTTTDYLTPTALQLGTIGSAPVTLKQLHATFDATGLSISQHFATSKDGTRVPYFLVAKDGLEPNGKHPTLLYGYGGFEVSQLPSYADRAGRAWLSQGGVYAIANIRGGGEYGPRWHAAALRENRPRAYEDFAAVAQDLIARKVTSPAHLGIQGGSNGGLLTGNMLLMYPELFGAVVSQVPLLDMKRYHKLLAGASWMAEYGDPDNPKDWAFIRTFSPYQNLRADAKLPPLLLTTSTRDDRVHPGHARKFAARMREQGHEVLYYENIEGGHGGASNNEQAAFMQALAWTFLTLHLDGTDE
jgi:prolyl oligopeptidase